MRACSYYTKKCDKWSEPCEAKTLDGLPGKPSNVTILCYTENKRRHLNLTWAPPRNRNAEIKSYAVSINCANFEVNNLSN